MVRSERHGKTNAEGQFFREALSRGVVPWRSERAIHQPPDEFPEVPLGRAHGSHSQRMRKPTSFDW